MAIDKFVMENYSDNCTTSCSVYSEFIRYVDDKANQVGISFYDMFSLLYHTGNVDTEIQNRFLVLLNETAQHNNQNIITCGHQRGTMRTQ